MADAKIDSMLKVYSMTDNKLYKAIASLKLPSIPFDNTFYIDKLFPRLDEKWLQKEYANGTINKITPMKIDVP